MPVKNIPYGEFLLYIRQKNMISARETLNSTREKISKSARENFLLPVKFFKNVPVKNTFYP